MSHPKPAEKPVDTREVERAMGRLTLGMGIYHGTKNPQPVPIRLIAAAPVTLSYREAYTLLQFLQSLGLSSQMPDPKAANAMKELSLSLN